MNRRLDRMTANRTRSAQTEREFPSPRLRTRVGEGGRIVIPAEFRKALGLSIGDAIVIRLDGEELRIFTPAEGVRKAQEIIGKHVPQGVSLVDELIAERRAEAEHE